MTPLMKRALQLTAELSALVDEMWLDHAERIDRQAAISPVDTRLENALFSMEEHLNKPHIKALLEAAAEVDREALRSAAAPRKAPRVRAEAVGRSGAPPRGTKHG